MLAPPAIASVGLVADVGQRACSMPVRALVDRPDDVDRVRARRCRAATWRSFSSSWLRRIGWPCTSWCACSGVSSSRLPSAPTPVAERHHDRLADRVDRRVRDLREQLLEVGEQRRRAGRTGRPARCRCPSSRSAPRRAPPSARAGRAGPPACSRTPAGAVRAARRRVHRHVRRQVVEVDDVARRTTRRTAAGWRPRA